MLKIAFIVAFMQFNLQEAFHIIFHLQIIVTMILLYMTLGYSALIGGAVILVLSPLQYKLAKLFSGVQKKTLVRVYIIY